MPRRAMNGLLRRLTRRRAAPADEIPPGTEAASEPVDAPAVETAPEPVPSSEEQERAAAERRAHEEERMRRARDVPAGLDPAEVEAPLESGLGRGRMRRRVRYLQAAREVLLRDLGGFYYEVHRTAGGHQSSGHRSILETKAGRLSAIDGELRELEARLGEPPAVHVVVREPGVGGTCPECGELHGSEAHFCSNCGAPLSAYGTRRQGEAVDATIAARQMPEAPAEVAPAPGRASRFGWPWRRAKLEPDPVESPAGAAGETMAIPGGEDAGGGERDAVTARDTGGGSAEARRAGGVGGSIAAPGAGGAEATGGEPGAGVGGATAGAEAPQRRAGDDAPTQKLDDETPYAERRA